MTSALLDDLSVPLSPWPLDPPAEGGHVEVELARIRAEYAAALAEEAQLQAEQAAAWLECVRLGRMPGHEDDAAEEFLPQLAAAEASQPAVPAFSHTVGDAAARELASPAPAHEPIAHSAGLHRHARVSGNSLSAGNVLVVVLLLVLSLYIEYRLEHMDAANGHRFTPAAALQPPVHSRY